MVHVIVVIREKNREKPDYYLPFDMPVLPNVGDYISIFRSDSKTQTEDVIVRHVWWHLYSPVNPAIVINGNQKEGRVQDIMVECDVAIGPYARDDWRKSANAAKLRGVEISEFEVDRVSLRESDINV